jgi:hypothetical protein
MKSRLVPAPASALAQLEHSSTTVPLVTRHVAAQISSTVEVAGRINRKTSSGAESIALVLEAVNDLFFPVTVCGRGQFENRAAAEIVATRSSAPDCGTVKVASFVKHNWRPGLRAICFAVLGKGIQCLFLPGSVSLRRQFEDTPVPKVCRTIQVARLVEDDRGDGIGTGTSLVGKTVQYLVRRTC